MTNEAIVFDSLSAMNVLGVDGRLTHRTVKPGTAPGLWTNQRWVSTGRPVKGYGAGAVMHVEMRFDDSCGNGHNTFAITGEVRTLRIQRVVACGCMHEAIAQVFPELAPMIKWHLTSTDGPMHYIANTLYLAGDRDHHGLRKGEQRQLRNGKTGLPTWELATVNSAGERVDVRSHFLGSEEKPEDPDARMAWVPSMIEGAGKPRELDAARTAAVWPEATDAELSVEPEILERVLMARHGELMRAFRSQIEYCGLLWSPEHYTPKA